MRWSNEMFYVLLLNSFTGAVAYIFWIALKKQMEKHKKLKYIYPMLGIVELFFLIPVMIIYLKITTHVPGTIGAYYGKLFLRTPVIYALQCVIAGIWILGVIFNLGNYGLEYMKFRQVLKKNIVYSQPRKEKDRIQKELGIKETVEIYQNYSVPSPIVVGWKSKKIIFPVKDYEKEELVTILYHEMIHIRQHILIMKKVAIFLKLIFWCNPMMTSLLQNIDEWGEVACDRYVCNETMYPYTTQEYYRIAVKGLEQSQIWMPEMVTGFQKKSNFKRRILRMKNYKKENEMKLIGGVALSMMLCIVTSTSIFAAGEGFKSIYEKFYNETEVTVEEEYIPVEQLEEYEEMIDPANYVDYEIVEAGKAENSSRTMGEITGEIGKGSIQAESIYVKKGQSVVMAISVTPATQSVRVGIIDNKNNMRYVNGKDSIMHSFEVSTSGYYTPVVFNDSMVKVNISGTYYVK